MGDGPGCEWCPDLSACGQRCWLMQHLAEREQVVRRARELLPLALAVVARHGEPTPLAGDTDAFTLALGFANSIFLTGRWCLCQAPTEVAYWAYPDGRHGWLCRRCKGITQLG